MYQERLKSKATETTFPSAWRKHRKESGPVIRADDVKVTAQSKQPPAPICFSILLQELGKMENWFSKEIIKPLKWVQTRRCRCTTSQDLWEHRLRVRRLETAKPPDFWKAEQGRNDHSSLVTFIEFRLHPDLHALPKSLWVLWEEVGCLWSSTVSLISNLAHFSLQGEMCHSLNINWFQQRIKPNVAQNRDSVKFVKFVDR